MNVNQGSHHLGKNKFYSLQYEGWVALVNIFSYSVCVNVSSYVWLLNYSGYVVLCMWGMCLESSSFMICCVEVVLRLTLGHGRGVGVESEAAGRREVREGIDQETGHVLVNVTHPGSHQGRRRRESQAERGMVSGESRSADIVHACSTCL